MRPRDVDAIVLFSGPGGVCEGLRLAGLHKVIGIEIDPSAVETARAAGHMTLPGDVRDYDPRAVCEAHNLRADGRRLLIQASPPCQGLSTAGDGKGRNDLGALARAVESGELGECHDDRSPLTIEVLRWVEALSPDYVMLEQVPAALPVWEAIGGRLRDKGYAVWVGLVQAETFGVPQTRRRAILLASAVSDVSAPLPTHSRYFPRNPAKLDAGVKPWVSMADALGWLDERDLMGDVRLSKGTIRPVDEPAPTMTASMDNGNFQWLSLDHVPERARARVERIAARRLNNQSGSDFDLSWPIRRPAMTIAGRGLVPMPGANANRFNGRTKSRNDGLVVSVAEAGVLQSFPEDYPWRGTVSSQFTQVGNAVPPLMQKCLTLALVGAGAAESAGEVAA